MEDTSTGMDKPTSKKSYQLIYISLIIAPIMYFLILIILQIKVLDEINIPANFFVNNFLNLVLLAFIILSLAGIFFTYKILIPRARMERNIEYRSSQNVLILACGGTVIACYGLILGVLWWDEYNFVPIYIVLPFFGCAMIHGYYLYSRYILNENIRKNKSNEQDVNLQKSITKIEPIDSSQEIFKPFLKYLNKNEKFLLNYNPKIKEILIIGTVGIVSAAILSFIAYWIFSYVFNTNNLYKFNIYSLLFIGSGIFSVAILPFLLLLRLIKLKRTMYIFTSHKIIAKYPKEIKTVPYNKIISSDIYLERVNSQDIKILFEMQSEEGTIKKETLYLQYIPIKLNFLEKLKDLIKSHENMKKESEFSFN